MISVVTITFNNYEELLNTVNSVQGLPIEHIIVNGGKCEKTANFLKTFTGIHLSEKDEGISDAFNKGVKLATGDSIVYLNSGDTLINREYFSWADQELKKSDFVYSDIFFQDPIAGKIILKPHEQPLGRGMPFPHQTMIVRREIFSQIGPFKLDYKRAMCFEFTCRLLNAGKKGTYYPKATMLMDGNGISSTQETHTLAESKRAMIENAIYNPKNKFYFFVRNCGFYTRKTLMDLKLKPILKYLKIIKRKLS